MGNYGRALRVLGPSMAVLACVAAVLAAAAAAAPSANTAGTLFVSTHGSSGATGKNCLTASFTKIADAVAAVPSGGTVVVCPGTYAEDVIVGKPLTLSGQNARVDATGLENGIQVVSSDVTVEGFDVRNANGEGILVGVDSLDDAGLLPSSGPVLSNVTIDDVRAIGNDKGFNGTENGNCKYPGDCGGGIHLNVVENSTVSGSIVDGNADGILLTDDYGPNAHNLIVQNWVNDNTTECGIVLASHSSDAVSFVQNADGSLTETGRNPDLGGVYDNTIRDNVASDNGTAKAPPEFGGGGSGSGIGIFGSGAGSGAWHNSVGGNVMDGNGLAGFTIHAHHPGGEDVNGNDVVGNTFGVNNVGGDGFDGTVTNFQTTAIAVYSIPPVTMRISGNLIHNDAVGIWLTNTVNALGLNTNHFVTVGTPVVVSPPD